MTQPGIEPRSPGPLANTLLIRPIARTIIINNQMRTFEYKIVATEINIYIYK